MRGILKATTLGMALLALGCGSDPDGFVGFTLLPPTAVNDTFQVLGNGQLQANLLGNDTANGATVTAFQNPSAQGGTVAVTGDGQLTYTPPANQANLSDSFTYTLTNAAGTSTATVTIQIGARGFFVKNDAPGGGSGSQVSPFNTLAAAVAAAAPVSGAQIVVFRGDGTSTGLNTPVTLLANQSLRAFDGNAPVLSGPVTMANNTTLAGVRLQGGGVVATGAASFTVQDCTVANTTGDGLSVTNLVGSATLRNNTFFRNGGRGLSVVQNSGPMNLALSNTVVNNSTRDGIFANVTNTGNVTWSETNTTVNQAGNGVPFAGNSWFLNSRNTGALNATMSRCVSDGPQIAGLLVNSFDASNCTMVFDQGVVRNGPAQGFLLEASGSSTFKARVSNTLTNQNAAGFGFEADNDTSALMCLRVVNVTSDVYRLLNNSPSAPYNIENFTNFATENTGSITQLGTINSVAIGSCGIP